MFFHCCLLSSCCYWGFNVVNSFPFLMVSYYPHSSFFLHSTPNDIFLSVRYAVQLLTPSNLLARINGKFMHLQSILPGGASPPYGHFIVTATIFMPIQNLNPSFSSVKNPFNKATPLIRPDFYDPLVTVEIEFHCNSILPFNSHPRVLC